MQVGIRVLEPAGEAARLDGGLFALDVGDGEQPRAPGEEAADRPVEQGAEPELEPAVAEPARNRGEEPDLLHRARVGADQLVAGAAELAHETELVCLQILDAAPSEIRGLLRSDASEIAPIDQRHLRAARGQGGRGHRAVDPSAKDQDVESLRGELVQVGRPQRRRRLAHATRIHRPTCSQSARKRASSKLDPERRKVAPAAS